MRGVSLRGDVEQEDDIAAQDERRHRTRQDLISGFGRYVDRASYVDILFLALLVLGVSSLYFWLAPACYGLESSASGFSDAVFFSFVTFSSLGYGDIMPQGFGRIVAVTEVLSGVALTAMFIGKVASERQVHYCYCCTRATHSDALLNSLSGSRKYSDPIEGLANTKNIFNLNKALEGHINLSKALANYLVYNSHQAGVVQFGNFTTLVRLYDEVRGSFLSLRRLYRDALNISDATAMRRILANMASLHRIVTRMRSIHQSVKRADPLWKSTMRAVHLLGPATVPSSELSAINRLTKLEATITKDFAADREWSETGYHPIQIERLLVAFPSARPWSKGVTKVVAQRLGISIKTSGLCVDALLASGRLKK